MRAEELMRGRIYFYFWSVGMNAFVNHVTQQTKVPSLNYLKQRHEGAFHAPNLLILTFKGRKHNEISILKLPNLNLDSEGITQEKENLIAIKHLCTARNASCDLGNGVLRKFHYTHHMLHLVLLSRKHIIICMSADVAGELVILVVISIIISYTHKLVSKSELFMELI